MDKFYISEQFIASSFYSSLKSLMATNDYKEKMIMIEKGDNDMYTCYYKKMSIPRSQILISDKILNLMKNLLTPSKNKEKMNFFQACQSIFKDIEIFCQDTYDNILITSEGLVGANLLNLKSQKNFEIVLDLLKQNKTDTEINLYYRENEINKFKFKTQDKSSSAMIIDIGEENYINDYFNNIRALLGCLICQVYFQIQVLTINCSKYIIEGKRETYYGQLQRMICPEIKTLMRNINVATILHTIKPMSINSYIGVPTLRSDMDILMWTNFMADIQPLLSKLEESEVIKSEIEKFLLLISYSFDYSVIDEISYELDSQINIYTDPIDMPSLISLIEECFRILKSEIDLNKKISSWILMSMNKIFSLNPSIKYITLTEVHKCTKNILEEKMNNLSIHQKINEIYKIPDEKCISPDVLSKFKAALDSDIDKITKVIKFILNLKWSEPILESIQNFINELHKKKNFFISLRNTVYGF